jgi:opacity protein-like surface antigen
MSRSVLAAFVSRSSVLVVAVAISSASPAAAQSHAKSLELTAWNGYYIASDLYRTTGAQIGIHNGYEYGARLGINLNPRLGIEGSWGHTSSDMLFYSHTSGFPTGTPLGSLTINQYDGNLLFMQRKSPKVTTFFTLGFGATNFAVDTDFASGDHSKTHFAWNVGIGSKIAMNDKISVRLDARYRVTDTNISTDSGVYCDAFGYCYTYNTDWYDSGELSGGLTYRLGGR